MSQTSTIVDVSEDGIVKLANKAVYRIPPGHIPRTKQWAPGTQVIVDNSRNAAWQYVVKSAATPGPMGPCDAIQRLLGLVRRSVIAAP